MNIPNAEYRNPRSSHDVTPGLRSLIRRNAGLSPSRPSPVSAPVVSRAAPAPVSGGDATLDAVQRAVQVALAPIWAQVESLRASRAFVTRSARRRAVVPQVTREAARAAMGLEPLVTRSVQTYVHGGLPRRRAVFSPQEAVRRSMGLPMVSRSVEPPSVFKSRYQPSSQFPTAAARDRYDSQFENKPVGVPLPPGVVERNLAQFPVL